ncbi:GspH/FimT family protein [Acidovorax sp. PRC11]|uniref:GspH/FimT family pseudopilin n=1 Tax=Acidovorax sp. PRC11 TaxID=2962592 RepID=UPI0028816F9F|nr:GspH/FimT family protein [Acidovorax sp. PRC11]MDT0140057.1 GspH/FimT family protein [Acidovorax sp. PRC11]
MRTSPRERRCRPLASAVLRGFTLVELMVTLAVVVVLLRICVPGFRSIQRNSELTSAANGLLASINAARTEAMKRNLRAAVVPADGSSWAGGWVVYVDIDGSDGFNAAKDLVVSTQPALASYFSMSGNNTAAGRSPYILFNGSGYPVTKDSAPTSLSVAIARNDLADDPSREQTRRVVLSKTGRVRVCKPASSSDSGCSSASN